ncbi:hypothetical protein F5Y03DRAFT_68696 [Xylaria venustula]|nr:hypothetical protein F5Y03DRAFT_68696 [Xylaria venustula]
MATEPSKDALTRAIDNADGDTLRAVLASMCQASDVCRKEAASRLLVSRKREIIELSDSSDDEGKNSNNNQKKRRETVDVIQESKFEKCKTCKKIYDTTLNNDEACQAHKGWLEIDAECFPDDDEVEGYCPSHIDPETDWRREEWPEGFIWQCCMEPSNGKPCLIQRHTPDKPQKPRFSF